MTQRAWLSARNKRAARISQDLRPLLPELVEDLVHLLRPTRAGLTYTAALHLVTAERLVQMVREAAPDLLHRGEGMGNAAAGVVDAEHSAQ